MLTSYGPRNFLRRGFHLLNSVLINSSGPSSGTLTPSIVGKEQKFLVFRRTLSQLTQDAESSPGLNGNFIQMRGLPYSATTTDVINFFKPLNVEPVEVIFRADRLGRPNGIATAKFKSYDDALIALRNHRKNIGQRYIELSLNMQVRNEGFPQRSLEPVPDISAKGHRVILKGLPYEATSKDVYQFFAPLNIKPLQVEMKYRNHVNLPSGICHCIFETQEDALTALKNNRAYIGRRWIQVFLASKEMPLINDTY